MSKVHSSDHSVPNKPREGPIRKFFEKYLVNQTDSADYSAAWRAKFSHTPTWCDADMSLQQINRGLAQGNRIALYSRSFFQQTLFKLGCFIQKWPTTVAIISMILYTLCCVGLKDVVIEVDIVKLWVPQGGRLEEELNFLNHVRQTHNRIRRDAPIQPAKVTQGAAQPRKGPELPKENGLGGGFQVVIQTPRHDGENVLTKEGLLRHVTLMEEIANYTVDLHGESWRLADLCFKPPAPNFQNTPLAKVLNSMLDKMIPCIWITPIDCFWEGAKPLGPTPPINLGGAASAFVTSLPEGDVTWKNLDPTAVMTEVGQLFDLGPVGNFFERAGIGAAYLDRPCIDPLDYECPKTSPNYFDKCAALVKFTEWNMKRTDRVELEKEEIKETKNEDADSLVLDIFGKKRRKRAADTTNSGASAKPKTNKKDEDYYAYEDDSDYSVDGINSTSLDKKGPTPEERHCMEYGRSFVKWMSENPNKWGEFLTKEEQPRYPKYGDTLTSGCKGFGKNIMEWPEDLIVGGIKRSADGKKISTAEALQSVFLVASPFDIYLRYKDGGNKDKKPNLDVGTWNPGKAQDVLFSWQRNFTKNLYNHKVNFEIEGVRQFHPLASTSIADMLEEFSQFNYGIIIMGYVLMVFYAAWTQARFSGWWLAVKSNVMLSFVGTMLVTYSSICGLGIATMMGIHFNAATTQIVPFLSLGLGIDDMFLLLHNYDEIIHTVKKNEMGVLLKETGLSVMVTSCNNILAFIAGTVLPIPALRSFCAQTAILLIFNLLSLMIIFPAFIEIDLRRVKKGKRDLCYCCGSTEPEKDIGSLPSKTNMQEVSSKAELAQSLNGKEAEHAEKWEREQPWYTVGGFLTYYYIPALKNTGFKIFVLSITAAMTIFGCYGMYTSTLGLELSDVLPEHTAPAAFLRAREKYFSFYPMFAVLRSETIDIPRQQAQIEEFRARLANTSFMIRTDEGTFKQPYWMSLVRVWLQSLDVALEQELANDVFDLNTGKVKPNKKPTPEGHIAQKLLCSFGNTYNCTGRLGHIKLVENGIIREDGFYNYLTGWFNIDNMMYYVSQASFFPSPPSWQMSPDQKPVPPAPRLLYSQIPFYQTGLTDTPVIVDMIEEIRDVCDEFTANGLSAYPTGIAFTFWDQYLLLRWHLLQAICIIAFAVFAVISLLMFNPWAATLVMVIVVILTIQLGGAMGIFGVKMNGISAVTQICAVGIGVEFTAHVVLCYLTSLGSVNERLESCLQHMFVPVFHGACSTFLGIVMLVFSQFDFVIKYFFVTMSVLVMLGVWNGLCVLPVLLTLVGPDCELTPTDGSNRLPAPPPLSKQGKKEKPIEDGLRHRKGDVELKTRAPSAQ